MYSNIKMLRINPLPQFSLTTDNIPYLQVGDRHRLAVDTFRELPGRDYMLDRSGVPKINKLNIDDRNTRQREVQKFAEEVYGLNELWEGLITNRPAFSQELIRFPYHGYRRKSIISDSPDKKNQLANASKIVEAIDGTKVKDESAKLDLSTVLGSTMDNSEKAIARRLEHSRESRKRHAYLRIEPYFNMFGTFGLFMPDIGYALSILGAFGIGMKHQDPKVRKSSIEILNAIAQGTVVKLHADLEQTGTNNDSALKQAYAEDAKSVLNGILKLLYCQWFGIHDDDEEVKSLAVKLETDLIDANLFISKLIKPRAIDPCKVLKS